MTKYNRRRSINVTARQTNKIEFLKRQVNDALTVVSEASAKYNSFVTKAAIFSELYDEAELDRQTAESYWKLFLQVKSDLQALNKTADEANMIGVDAFHDVRQLIIAWQEVTAQTIKAAETIVLAANYIQNRKASNVLISSELLSGSTEVVALAEKTVKSVVNAFSDALSALSSSAQANNSTELTSVYVNLAIVALLEEHQLSPALNLIPDPGTFLGLELPKQKVPLESSLQAALKAAKEKAKLALAASESANREMNKAREELSQAEAALTTWEDALTAAETAVAG